MDLQALLPTAMLERFRERAPGYDAENAFCAEDFEELRATGYLKAMLPVDRGGADWGMEAMTAAQRLLGSYAPATALAVNMHLVWTGVARLLSARGDKRLDMVLDWVQAGEVMAFGVSEGGNDQVLFDSRTIAVRADDGSYSFTGTKIFTSLAPAWTRLGVFGKAGTGDAALLVHGFLSRGTDGVSTADNWNTLGMRATQSHSTILADARVPAASMHSFLPVGPNADPLVFGIFAAFLSLTASVYVGLAERGVQLAASIPARRTSMKSGGRSLDRDPDIRRQVAAAGMELLSLDALLRITTRDLDELADHGASWFPRLVTLRTKAGEAARSSIDTALKVSGGGQYFRGSELERLYRDVLASLYHPSDAESAHSTVAGWLLGPVAD
ncbi:acyl-CoA dehydrogenase family protein [Paeniglutamicibacter cryotolerans]|uniref:Alkylation response protein AidB-like acyl-CoA dehydrogenase n=1 Tax=Paeniglutamicibacter cryotolerans TaxID=670079 RepID=A0A839QVE9_9MICC|nr:acyl-CoA dehydrogenase family protein [Paeniglutamicibacter cryotolerans]MBB2997272.1 alkylation response protein AidB-like acyl-CoA dehydrogenase [Paeniglutamicibacter cryotolerans]